MPFLVLTTLEMVRMGNGKELSVSEMEEGRNTSKIAFSNQRIRAERV